MIGAKLPLALLAAAFLTMPVAAAEPAVEPVAGELLIASAAIQDPRFHHAVILLLRHDDKGAFGIVINHPLTERPIAGLLAESGGQADQNAQDSAIEGNIRVFLGGPVEPSYGFVARLHALRLERAAIRAEPLGERQVNGGVHDPVGDLPSYEKVSSVHAFLRISSVSKNRSRLSS